MKRRRYLLLAGGSGIASLAGCLDDDEDDVGVGDEEDDDNGEEDDDNGEEDDDNGEEDDDNGEDRTETHIEDARANLDTAARLIEDEAEEEDEEFEVGDIDDALEDAIAALDEAESDATDEQLAEIDELRNVASWLQSLADVVRELEDGFDAFDTAVTYSEHNRFEDAIEQLDTSLDHFGDAEFQLILARNEFESVDHDTLDSLGDYDAADAEDVMTDLEEAIAMMQGFTAGYRDLTVGFDHFLEGADALDDERWNDAIDPLRDASDEFAAARREFEDLEDESSPDMLGDVLDLVCMAGAFEDGADHYANAAEAARADDWDEYYEQYEAAEQAMERCD